MPENGFNIINDTVAAFYVSILDFDLFQTLDQYVFLNVGKISLPLASASEYRLCVAGHLGDR